MAKGLNKVTLLGNLGRAVEVKATAGGIIVANFSLATADRVKQNGEWKDSTEWHNCVAFGRTAEILRDYTGKGSKVHIEGKLRTSSWDDKETGQKRYRTEILVNELILLDPAGARKTGPEDESQEVPGYAYTRESGDDDDQIPF